MAVVRPPSAGTSPGGAPISGTFFLALRRLRLPLIFLISVYAIGIVGLLLIPAVDPEGRPWRMSVFHAFYFISYTASTIGFGEIPYPFSDEQRLWSIVIIYLSVFGWAYTLGSVFSLAQDRAFRQAVTVSRFGRRVRRLSDPFFVVCGYGEAGQIVCRELDARGFRVVVLDLSEERIGELELQDFRSDVAGLATDASLPDNLLRAGIAHRFCRGVIAMADDRANLAVAVAVKLLNSKAPVVTRATSESVAASMRSFGTDYVVKPFVVFTEQLVRALATPEVYRLAARLDDAPGAPVVDLPIPPKGRWLVCGYGSLGDAVLHALDDAGNDVTVVDPSRRPPGQRGYVQGVGTEPMVLGLAGVGEAVGLVASTDDDIRNMAIAVAAREKNPHLFEIVRQRKRANRALFAAFRAEITMVVSDIIARRVLSIVDAPLFVRFLSLLGDRDDAWALAVSKRLDEIVGPVSPLNWGIQLNAADAPALHRALMLEGRDVRLSALLADPRDREHRLNCLPLLLVRDESDTLLPEPGTLLRPGDALLFAGTRGAQRAQQLTLTDANVRDYVVSGREPYRGWVFEWLAGRRQRPVRHGT
jgi:Trk K+ transport system NAD-binding subunit